VKRATVKIFYWVKGYSETVPGSLASLKLRCIEIQVGPVGPKIVSNVLGTRASKLKWTEPWPPFDLGDKLAQTPKLRSSWSSGKGVGPESERSGVQFPNWTWVKTLGKFLILHCLWPPTQQKWVPGGTVKVHWVLKCRLVIWNETVHEWVPIPGEEMCKVVNSYLDIGL
jgi:hypothetical protein